jgi:hypothetical protein
VRIAEHAHELWQGPKTGELICVQQTLTSSRQASTIMPEPVRAPRLEQVKGGCAFSPAQRTLTLQRPIRWQWLWRHLVA